MRRNDQLCEAVAYLGVLEPEILHCRHGVVYCLGVPVPTGDIRLQGSVQAGDTLLSLDSPCHAFDEDPAQGPDSAGGEHGRVDETGEHPTDALPGLPHSLELLIDLPCRRRHFIAQEPRQGGLRLAHRAVLLA